MQYKTNNSHIAHKGKRQEIINDNPRTDDVV